MRYRRRVVALLTFGPESMANAEEIVDSAGVFFGGIRRGDAD